jgi:hypothetical protein
MPRWLSEGISVYEELEKNPSWGQHMSPDYRQRIMRNEMTPIGELSGAFMNAESGEDMQFAYYQSSLVVAYIVEKFGQSSLRKYFGRSFNRHSNQPGHRNPHRQCE